MSIENQLPYNIQCTIDNNDDKKIILRPLQNKYFLDINQDNSKMKITMKYHNITFHSNQILLNNNVENIIQIKLFQENGTDIITDVNNNNDKFIECNMKIEENLNIDKLSGIYESEYEKIIKTFQRKKKFIIYSNFIIINKLDNLLFIRGKDMHRNQFSFDNYNGMLFPNYVNIMNNNNLKQTYKLKTENSDWSKKFNINTIGNSGVNTLEISNQNKIINLDVGVTISSSWNFVNSILVTIEPRFLLINKFGYDIEYKQYNNKKSKNENDNENIETLLIKDNEEIKLNLVKEGNKKMIQLKLNRGGGVFSSPFDLEEMGDLDVKFPINDDLKNKINKKNKEIEKQIKKNKQKIIKDNGIVLNDNNKKNDENIINTNNNENNIKELDENISEMTDENEDILNNSYSDNIKKILSKNDIEVELTPQQEKQKKISDKMKKIAEMKLKPRKYYIFSQNEQTFLLMRITKKIINGLIYIILYTPEYPQYIIENESQEKISIKQKKDSFNRENIDILPKQWIPYIWGDPLKNEKLLILEIANKQIEINLNEIKIIQKNFYYENEVLTHKKNRRNRNNKTTFYFQTVIVKNKIRKLIIKNAEQNLKQPLSFLERIKLKNSNKNFNIKINFNFKGFGISIINSEPRELFYISFYGILLDANINNYYMENNNHLISNVKLMLKNFQMDYCLNDDHFKNMIVPLSQITPQTENYNMIPLFQGIITFHRISNPLLMLSSDEFPQLDFVTQPIKVNISQYQLMNILDLVNEIIPQMDYLNLIGKKNNNKKILFNNITELEKYIYTINDNNLLEYEPEHYDDLLNTNLTILPEEIISDSEKHYRFFIKNISIGALKIILTTRIDLNKFKTIVPDFIMNILSFLGNILTHITDYNLNFPALLYTNVFSDIYQLSFQIKNEYLSQLKRRIFKIIGCLDILGNPINYASSIGDGFLQLFIQPGKNLINGPIAFGGGVAKGFGIFISSIFSSTFDVVGKISGTLLTSCQELQGNSGLEFLENKEPKNIFEGVYRGFKDGFIDLGKGFSGIVTKPYYGAKNEGIKGFFKGVENGVFGAAISPLTLVFRLTNNVFVGLKNTANIFNPQLKSERFRYPRCINKNMRLCSYNEDISTIKEILNFIGGYDDHEIIFFNDIKYVFPGLSREGNMLVLTNKSVLIIYHAMEVVFEIMVRNINNVEVHKGDNEANVNLIFYMRNNSRKYITTTDFDICACFYLMFEKEKNDAN